MSVDNVARQLKDQSDKVRNTKQDYMKHVLLMASAVMGALLALYKKPDTAAENLHIVFASASALIVLGILLLSIGLYQESNNQERLLEKYKEQVRIFVRTGKEPSMLGASPKKIYLWAEKLGYIALSSSLILFVVYLFI